MHLAARPLTTNMLVAGTNLQRPSILHVHTHVPDSLPACPYHRLSDVAVDRRRPLRWKPTVGARAILGELSTLARSTNGL